MIAFSNFYQLIAKITSPTGWRRCLRRLPPAADQQHGLLKQWANAVEFLPELTPHRLDLLHSVTAESEEPLPPGRSTVSKR